MWIFFKVLLNLRVDIASDDHYVGPPIVIEISESGSPLYIACVIETRRSRRILEKFPPTISVEYRQIICEMSFEDVQKAVAIVVADSDTHSGLRLTVLVV